MPLISVIVPATGRVALLQETLASLAAQTLRDFELIVTDDSPEEGDAVAIEAAVGQLARDHGLAARYLRTAPRLGQSRNTNQGLEAATAPWVRILHGDDLLAPHALACEAALIADHAPRVEVFTAQVVRFSGAYRPTGSANRFVSTPHWWVVNLLPWCAMLPSSVLFHRRFLDDGLRYDPSYDFCCDWVFTLGLLAGAQARGTLIVQSGPDWVGYRQHADSVSGRQWHTHYVESRRFLNHLLEGGLAAAGFDPDAREIDSIRGVGWEGLRSRAMVFFRNMSDDKRAEVAGALDRLMREDAGMAFCPFGQDDPRFFEELAERQFYPQQAAQREAALQEARRLRAGVPAGRRIIGVRGQIEAGQRYLDNACDLTLRIDFTRPEDLLAYADLLRPDDILDFLFPDHCGDPRRIIPALLASKVIGNEVWVTVCHAHFCAPCPVAEIVEQETGGRFQAIEGGVEGSMARWRFRRMDAPEAPH